MTDQNSKPITKAEYKAQCVRNYNAGYRDAINGRKPDNENFYYLMGHEEGWPKRLIPTTIMTSHGPITERCTLERAAFLLASNSRTPGARR